jgi:hypothetical protein
MPDLTRTTVQDMVERGVIKAGRFAGETAP